MKPVAGISAEAVVRFVIAAIVSVVLTVVSLLGVRALTDVHAPPQEPPAATETRSIPLAPPPKPAEASPTELAELRSLSSLAPTPSEIPPPAPAAPAVAGLAPTAAAGTLALGPIGELPSVAGLPSSALEEVPQDNTPTTPARATSRPSAEYPALAQRRGLEGYVTLRLRIDERGRVVDAVVVDSKPKGVFDATAKRAVRRYRFSPARAGTQPVASTLQQTIRFELDR